MPISPALTTTEQGPNMLAMGHTCTVCLSAIRHPRAGRGHDSPIVVPSSQTACSGSADAGKGFISACGILNALNAAWNLTAGKHYQGKRLQPDSRTPGGV